MGRSHRNRAYFLLWLLVAFLILTRSDQSAPVIELSNADPSPLSIDLNQDPWERLTLIPGLGKTLAQRIVTFREARGGFRTLDEVKSIPGIPDRAIEEASPWLVLGEFKSR